MVAPTITHRESLTTDLLRGLERAKAEHLVVYRISATTPGVASIEHGVWTARPYTLTLVGDAAGELTCSCMAGRTGTICKHLSAGIAARKWGVYALPPTTPVPARNALLDILN